ncbi:MAG: VCBS repeat-containing protein [Burkholderiales bacterium]|nr:VCBS repeat-containing protein [Burkholderiales bacterium]
MAIINGSNGNDTITLGAGDTYVSGPGNDNITGAGASGYALWGAQGTVVINLAQGWAQDGYGGTDQLSGITELHLPGHGATVTGTGANEVVFCFGGHALIDLAGGSDTVRMHELQSSDYAIRQFGSTVYLTGTNQSIELRNVETLAFADRSFNVADRGDDPYFAFAYDVHSFVETEWSEGWWYAGVYNPPTLVSYFPQAVNPFDIDADGDMDLVIPLNRGYRTGVDTRYHFQVLENVGGTITYSEVLTESTAFIAGSRRTETIWLERYGSSALVTVAHDTAIETETRYDIPWRFGDITITLADPFEDVASDLVPDNTLPKAQLTGRDTAVDAHSMAVGDVNGDGMDDIVVGEFGGVFYLQQTLAGTFTYQTSNFLQSLAGWKEPTLPDATSGVLIDLHMADLDGDGFDDLVVGWGHNTSLSRVFFNDGHGTFSVADSATLPVSLYGASNNLHMKTFSEDFDGDGDLDLVVLQSRYEPYYGGNYLQFLRNDGSGGFTDATVARFGDPAALDDTFTERLHWTDFWQVLDANGDGALDIAGHTVSGSDRTPFIYMNDGTGHFDRVDLPGQAGSPVTWGDYDGDGNIELVTFYSTWNDAQGTSSTNTFSVYEMQQPNSAHAIAYDLQGNAGDVAKILGAVFGAASVSNATYAGIGLSYIDDGMSRDALFGLALDVALGAGRSNQSVVTLLYTNVVGSAPSDAVRDSFVSLIESGSFTQVSLGWLAAGHPLNLDHIGFVGLQQNGLEYLPA